MQRLQGSDRIHLREQPEQIVRSEPLYLLEHARSQGLAIERPQMAGDRRLEFGHALSDAELSPGALVDSHMTQLLLGIKRQQGEQFGHWVGQGRVVPLLLRQRRSRSAQL